MRFCYLALVLALVAPIHSEEPKKNPTPSPEAVVWNLPGFELPESAFYDAATGKLYVSNVASGPDAKDGKGFLSIVTLDGKIEKLKWVTGLNSPKGIRIHKGILWVSCVDELVSVDIAKGEIIKKVKIEGAKFLNDVAVDATGTVYVTDMLGNKIYTYDGKEAKVFIEGEELEWPNGVLVDGDRLLVGGWGKPEADFSTKVPGRLMAFDIKTKKKTLITPKPTGNLDGIELDGKGGYIVTDWKAGKVLHIGKDGETKTLIEGFQGAADHAFLPAKNLLIQPRMVENTVTAYDLSKLKK
ncbi:MAG: SMP-30/gluconolactonase/LRE family protein [Planctomycetes bacterium]|nr:SMP-30/gluconolactonase/LRE family protein [Planctomycetota bacterium]